MLTPPRLKQAEFFKNGGKGAFLHHGLQPLVLSPGPAGSLRPSALPHSQGHHGFDGGFHSKVLTRPLLHVSLGNTFQQAEAILLGAQQLSGMDCGPWSLSGKGILHRELDAALPPNHLL